MLLNYFDKSRRPPLFEPNIKVYLSRWCYDNTFLTSGRNYNYTSSVFNIYFGLLMAHRKRYIPLMNNSLLLNLSVNQFYYIQFCIIISTLVFPQSIYSDLVVMRAKVTKYKDIVWLGWHCEDIICQLTLSRRGSTNIGIL